MGGTLGLIAGSGSLPIAVCETAKKRSVAVVAVTFNEANATGLGGLATVYTHPIGKVGKTIKILKSAGAKKVVLIGKFKKAMVFTDLMLDVTGAKIMAKRIMKRDSSIMLSIIEELEKNGLIVEKQTDWLPNFLPPKGLLGKHKPSKDVQADFDYGFELCKDLAGKDVGQTLIVKGESVIAVEAVEGTDETIERGCRLAGGSGAVMIKTSRPKQDFRFDIPSVGLATIEHLVSGGASGLAVEAGRTVVVNLPEVVAACDEAGLPFVAI